MENRSWSESFGIFAAFIVAGVFIILGAEFGVFPIVIIAPVVAVISFYYGEIIKRRKRGKYQRILMIIFMELWD